MPAVFSSMPRSGGRSIGGIDGLARSLRKAADRIEFARGGALEAQDLVRYRMLEHEKDSMEADPASGVRPGSITKVACYRITFGGKLRADLVLAAGFQPELEAAVAPSPRKDPVLRDGLERAFLAGPCHPHPGGA